MKRNYLSPAVETTEILVEAGIAMSNVIFELGEDANYEDYNDGAAIW